MRTLQEHDGNAIVNTTANMADLHRRADTVRARIALSSIVGADVALVKQGREHAGICPFHSDTKLGNFYVNDAKAIFKCFACSASGDHMDYLVKRKGMTFMEALRLLEADAGIDFTDKRKSAEYDRAREKRQRENMEAAAKRRRNAVGLWMHAATLRGTPAEAYLAGRGIDFAKLGRYPGAIRFRHDCWNTELGRPMPAMVTKMTMLDGTHAATHRTYLELVRGRWVKASVDKAKLVLGDYTGAHISLSKGDTGRVPLKDVPDGTAVAISEGIEDGLTVAMADPALRVLAATSLNNIGNLALPAAVSDVILVAQNDEAYRAWRAMEARRAGDEDAAAHHERAARQIMSVFESQIAAHQVQGRTVKCLWPQSGFKDFNDALRGISMREAA
jgi:hypothetical protein